ncbi:MAG TPA: phospholipid carrier-dependent glycosyltransferase, partial [Gemmatimonadales bacterium]|nr:phospholipid carrier-dependent glycosyltransferase [Gemmatimonadales bacterium]
MAETPIEAVRARWQSAPAARVVSLVLRWQVGLLLILAAGGAMRFHGLDWDVAPGTEHPQQMHPDERFLSLVSNRLDWPDSIGGYFDTARSPLNPYNDPETHSYVYGTFPLFLGKAVSTIVGDDPAGIDDSYDTTIVWGRRLAAGADTITILLVFLIGSTLFGKRAGLAGAGLYALAVLPTQLAHFWTVDPFLTFFGALALLEGVTLARERSTARSGLLYAALGVTLGLAVACKINGAFFFVVPVAVTALRWGLRDDRRMDLRWQGELEGQLLPDGSIKRLEAPAMSWMNDVSFLFMAVALALITFRIAQPYAFTGPHFWEMGINQQWLDDIRRELDFQQGKADYPPFVQWAGRTPFLWPLRNMVSWGMGPALGIAAWVSLVAAGVFMFRRREMTFLLPLAFILPVFAFQGSRFVAFMRYFEPIYPALCVLAGWGLVSLWGFARSGRALPWGLPAWGRRVPAKLRDPRIAPAAALAAVALVVGATAWWAMAFQSVYSQEHPRIAASRWIIDTLPSGSRITGEFWDDTLPYPLPNPDEKKFKLVDLEPYLPDSPEKVRQMVYGFPPTQPGQDRGQGLNGADYVAISSNRIRDSVTRLEREYPATIRYYNLLESGELGFDLVKTF